MRSLVDLGALLASIPILMRIAQQRFGDSSEAALEARAERWRAW
jgi:hypothetical protein